MKCLICKHGETRDGTATVTLERDNSTIVVWHVPARVCDTCGEECVDEAAADELLILLNEAADRGVQLELREYAAA